MHPLETGPQAVRDSWNAGGPRPAGLAPRAVPARFAEHGLRLGAGARPEAVGQAQDAAKMLRALVPGLAVTVQVLADSSPGRAPQAGPGGGEPAAAAGRALPGDGCDAAVCRLADVPPPGTGPGGLAIAAYLPRGDTRYCLVLPAGSPAVRLGGLPAGARVAAAGAGCAEQLTWRRGDLDVRPAGPDVTAALALLDAGGYDALVAPAADLPEARASAAESIEADVLYPPASTGTVIRCNAGDGELAGLLRLLDHWPARACADAEQALADSLPGDAGSLAAVHCTVKDGDGLALHAVMSVPAAGGTELAAAEATGPASEPAALGNRVAAKLVSAAARAALFTKPLR